MRKLVHFLLPPFLLLLALTVAMEFVVRLGLVPDFLLPAPSQVFATFAELREDFARAFSETAVSAVVGLLGAVLAGGGAALALSRFGWLERALFPFTVLFQTVPIVAIAPLLVVWFGFGATTVRISAFIVAIFPVLANTLTGLHQTPPELLELFRSFRASSAQTLWRLRVPFAVPYFLAGVEIAAGLAVIGAIVGEFVAGSGLGALIDSARAQQRVDIIFAAVLAASLFGVILIGLIRALRHSLRRYLRATDLH